MNRIRGYKVMPAGTPKTKFWLIRVAPDEAHIRCTYERLKGQIIRFTVQLEIQLDDHWTPIIRYDNAHGFSHCDTLHPDGSQDKALVDFGDENATFTRAIEELRSNWPAHRDRYLGELKP